MATKIDQKEYLKRYLSNHSDEKKKKKKKAHKIKHQTVTLIDDDVDISKLRSIDDKDDIELLVTGEDAPQVVGVVDDRPPELIALDFKNSNKWKVLSEQDGWGQGTIKVQQQNRARSPSSDQSPSRKSRKKRKDSSSDASPPRRKRKDSDRSPPRRRKSKDTDTTPPRKRKDSSDASPPRRRQRSPDSDASPPQRRRSKDLDMRRRASPDASPPRRKHRSPDSDASPPRRRRSKDLTPPRKLEKRRDSDHSPPRRRKASDSDATPPRKKPPRERKSRFDASPPRRNGRTPDPSPPRRGARKSREKSSSPPPTHRKMAKTLDGKSAGLQSAKSVRAENEQFRQREKQMFETMAAPDSSRVVIRDRKTGRIRDFDEERRREAEKQKELDKRKEIYDRWGRGVKQTEEYSNRLAEHVHEMNKPLARYSDDTDLEEHLKKQERMGDPMLEYLRQKEKQQQRKAGVPERPMYKGIVPDNRFNIRPGYRWDGVDRSNGYEQKWFETQSKKEAGKEEIYKYSVEDM